jgi:hypothetical protein
MRIDPGEGWRYSIASIPASGAISGKINKKHNLIYYFPSGNQFSCPFTDPAYHPGYDIFLLRRIFVSIT